MAKVRFVNAVLATLFVILVPIVLLLTDVQLTAFDRGYYQKEYIKYNIPEHIGMSMDNLMNLTEQLLEYLDNKRADLDFKVEFMNGTEEFFSPRDKQHMVDVKNLFVNGRYIRNFAFAYIVLFLIYLYYRKPFNESNRKLARYGIIISAVGIIPVIILVILMSLDFYRYFTIFHEIFFNNDLWLLDPAVDRLVNIFPEEFFTDMAFRIAYYYIAEMAAILLAGLTAVKFVKPASK
ncbi:MAG: TIGR01906 family membrane protein [Caulobacteraceae bacterium]